MTASISKETRHRAFRPSVGDDNQLGRPTLVIGVWCFTVSTGLIGVAAMSWAFAYVEWRTALTGATLLILSGAGGVVLCLRALLAARQKVYQRGQLDGWMRGWRGQDPEVTDPLLE
jgi:hypothetical protein